MHERNEGCHTRLGNDRLLSDTAVFRLLLLLMLGRILVIVFKIAF